MYRIMLLCEYGVPIPSYYYTSVEKLFFCYCYVPTAGDFFYNASGFFKDKVEFQRGYRCDATQEHPLKYRNLTKYMYQISANLTVRDFHVQAFQFKDAGKFGNGELTLSLSLSLSLSFSLSLTLLLAHSFTCTTTW